MALNSFHLYLICSRRKHTHTIHLTGNFLLISSLISQSLFWSQSNSCLVDLISGERKSLSLSLISLSPSFSFSHLFRPLISLNPTILQNLFDSDVYVEKLGFDLDEKPCGNMSDARKLFDESPVLELVSRNLIFGRLCSGRECGMWRMPSLYMSLVRKSYWKKYKEKKLAVSFETWQENHWQNDLVLKSHA